MLMVKSGSQILVSFLLALPHLAKSILGFGKLDMFQPLIRFDLAKIIRISRLIAF